jgi:hypothetical protein
MEHRIGLPEKFYDPVKTGIKNNINHLIIAKPSWPVTSPQPVPAPNLSADNHFLKDYCKVEEVPIYQHLPEIPVVNDFCDIEDCQDNETNCLDDEYNGDN